METQGQSVVLSVMRVTVGGVAPAPVITRGLYECSSTTVYATRLLWTLRSRTLITASAKVDQNHE
jgi:hypothetical protein